MKEENEMVDFTIVTRSEPPCIYCVRAKSILKRKGYTWTEIDYADDPIKAENLMATYHFKSFPMILNGNYELVGGADDLVKLLNNDE